MLFSLNSVECFTADTNLVLYSNRRFIAWALEIILQTTCSASKQTVLVKNGLLRWIWVPISTVVLYILLMYVWGIEVWELSATILVYACYLKERSVLLNLCKMFLLLKLLDLKRQHCLCSLRDGELGKFQVGAVSVPTEQLLHHILVEVAQSECLDGLLQLSIHREEASKSVPWWTPK